MEIKEIKEFKEYMVHTRHGERVRQQEIDQEYFEDTFPIPHIHKTDDRKKEYEIRTGFISEMSNGFTQQLIASTPKVFTEPRVSQGTVTKEREESSDRIASVCNKWCYKLGQQSHNPFKQTFKYMAFTRGEAWIYIPHNPELAQWKGKEKWQALYPEMVPVHFMIYDPLVVFSDPSEDIDGKPTRVLVYYKRLVSDILTSYPKWGKGKDYKPDQEVEFYLYVDKEITYAEADDESLFRDKQGVLSNDDGRRKNPSKEVPFSHAYSGWGVESQNKKPDLLAFSRTRMLRGRVAEDTSMAADFSYNIHAFAFKHRTLLNQSGQELGDDWHKEYHPNEPGKLSILNFPPGADVKVEDTQLFDAPVFAYRNQVKADLSAAYPSALRGVASGSSGRQEDILAGMGLSFYDSPVDNNSTLWAQAFDKALKIAYGLPDMIPPGLQKDDIKSFSEIRVNTRKDDPLASIRRAADGDRKYELGIIDLLTNLVDYQGQTKEEAKNIMAALLVDSVTRNDPVFRQLMGISLAREIGVEDDFNRLSVPGGTNPEAQFGTQGGEPREGNIKTEAGREQMDMSLVREPPRKPAGV